MNINEKERNAIERAWEIMNDHGANTNEEIQLVRFAILMAKQWADKSTPNELIQEVHQNAIDHGWWDEPRSMAELLCLIHSEVSEALEEDRDHRKPGETYYSGKNVLKCHDGSKYTEIVASTEKTNFFVNNGGQESINVMVAKPEGIPSELADIVIRVMDICGHFGIDLEAAISEKMEYNRTRPMRHGGKKL